ncbi:MAG: GlsB/YeaQ/YmgE family stress response membrane protein [Acidobacteriota bacterium]|nr:GlsB/YeaQ/YmgE family stress response membrane protein [Acidobacteriota bacterium]
MSILAWIVLGLVAGYIGSKIVNKSGEGIILDVVLGVLGAIAGGYLFNKMGAHGVTGLNLYSLFVAVVGSVLLLVLYHALFRRRRSWIR